MEYTIIQTITVWALPLIFAITLHEAAHGFVASFFGDQTARMMGRLSLNPIKHVDLIGTIIVPLAMLLVSPIIFGWAKPVPVDPRNLHNPRRDMAFVALAGPVSNIVMAIAWAGIAKVGMLVEGGGHSWWGTPLFLMGQAGIMINVVLAVLNLIPLPPLDGGKVLSSILPRRWSYYLSMVEPYSMWILILLIFTGLLTKIMYPIVVFLVLVISSLFGLA